MNRVLNGIIAIIIAGICSLNLFASDEGAESDNRNNSGKYLVVAYVQPFTKDVPDPGLMTNIYYSDCHIDSTLRRVVIPNIEYFSKILGLKKENPELKISICIQDNPNQREGFCEMTSSPELRKAFVEDCKEKVEQYNLDGIDLDWEFPGTTTTGHNATDDDARNYGILANELREALGDDKLLTFYSNNGAGFVDFDAMLPYVDYVMVSGYNLGMPPERHQSNLYPSKICGNWSVSQSVKRHIDKGVPPSKILLGVPFYARTIKIGKYDYYERRDFDRIFGRYQLKWDNKAKVPYYSDEDGSMVGAMDNAESIRQKSDFIRQNGLSGMFYWNYNSDDGTHSLAKTVRATMMPD